MRLLLEDLRENDILLFDNGIKAKIKKATVRRHDSRSFLATVYNEEEDTEFNIDYFDFKEKVIIQRENDLYDLG